MSSTIGVAVLFTDLVDSTALSARLGASAAEGLRRVHFGLLRAAVTTNGGREVKTLGDGIMVVFSGVGAALDAAIGIQRATARHNVDNAELPLLLRIGIAAGDCVEDAGDYFGEPVVQGARLCARADGGQILTTAVVRAMSPRGRHEFVAAGDLELKGLPEPVAAVEVQWTADGTDAEAHAGTRALPVTVPLPDRLRIRPQFGVVGRTAEREVLEAALKAASAGDRRVVLLSGEAGVGKTSIAADLARDAFEHGALVCYGRCDDDLSTPYRPWVETLTHYVAHAGIAELTSLPSRVLGDLAALVPSVQDRAQSPGSGSEGGDGDQYALYAAVTAAVQQLAASRTVVFVLDDLHWADRGTLRLLQHVVASVTTGRLLLVGTYRDTDVGADDPLAATLSALRRETGVERVPLAGLSDVDIVAMMESVAGYAMDDEGTALAHALRDETDGNPFFVGEMLRHLAESGAITQRADGRWVATVDLEAIGLPQSVREVVGDRVRRLGDDVHRVLGAAAVVGRDFDLDIVAASADLDPDATLELFERAMDAGLITELHAPGDRFSFTHALVQHTLYQELPNSRRVRLHRKVAETIERVAGDRLDRYVPELAAHWFAVTRPVDVDKAIRYGTIAGDLAMASRAPEDAARWYRQVLDVIADRDERRRCEVLVLLGEAEQRAGDPEHRATLLRAAQLAQHLGAHDLLVRAALANNRGWHSRTGAADFDRIGALEAALAVVPDETASRALLLALLAVEYSSAGDDVLERRLAFADESVAIARKLGDPATLARVLDAGVFSTWVPERLAERVAWADEALRLAGTVGDAELDYWVALRRDATALECGDRATSEIHRARQLALMQQLGLPVMRWLTTCAQVPRAFLDGDLAGADATASEALELGLASGQPDALSYYGAQLVTIRSMQGRLGELESLIRQQSEANPGIPAFRVALAGLCADDGRDDEALALLADDYASGFTRFARDPMYLVNLTGAVRAVVAVGQSGDRDGAAQLAAPLFAMLLPWADRGVHIHVLTRPPVAHSLGLLAAALGREDVDEHFSTALDFARRLAAPLFVAMTKIDWAASQLERGSGDRGELRTWLDAGLEVAIASGAGAIERRARDVTAQNF